MEGQLAEHPLAELIREVANARLSGAMRLSKERAKVVVYFDKGKLVFAASNLRMHRLHEILQRRGVSDASVRDNASDDELANALVKSGKLTTQSLQETRNEQACDVLRVALLWTNGRWEFDRRVRLAVETRVQVDIDRLLLECARHLPFLFVKSRFDRANGAYSAAENSRDVPDLSPSEKAVLARVNTSANGSSFADLIKSGISQEDGLRSLYALSLSGLLRSSYWPSAFAVETSKPAAARDATRTAAEKTGRTAAPETDEAADVDALFARLKSAKDHYEVLDLPRGASLDEIKTAYHALALRFHPDRFHQTALRRRIESAFARIAQAYETLSDPAQRDSYDQKRPLKKTASAVRKSGTLKDDTVARSSAPDASRAESSFLYGMEALQRNQHDEAIRFLAEAAMLAPREARYRAHYGYALIKRSNMRRIAETELQTAVSIEPDNASFRVMLAELYQSLGLRRRAEGEAARALTVDPKNEAARALLSNLKSK